MPKDINSRVRALRSLSPAAHTTSRNGAGVAIGGAGSIMVKVDVGAVTTLNSTDKVTFTVKFGPDSDISNATAVSSSDYYHGARSETGDAWTRVLDDTFVAPDIDYQFGVENVTNAAYAFVVATSAGSPSVICGASIILGDLPVSPNPDL